MVVVCIRMVGVCGMVVSIVVGFMVVGLIGIGCVGSWWI